MTPHKMKPVGHDPPEARREYSKPDRKLQLVFEKWLNKGVPRMYKQDFFDAQTAIKTLDANIDEAHGLLLEYESHQNLRMAGLFLSAIYAKHPDEHIIYDVETRTPIDHIGYGLLEHKILIIDARTGKRAGSYALGLVLANAQTGYDTGAFASGTTVINAQAGNSTGRGASGLIITNEQTGRLTGLQASGIIITNAHTDESMGWQASGLFLTPTNPKNWAETFNGTHIDAEQIQQNDKLREYLTKLHETTKMLRTIDDIAAFKEKYGKKPQEKIKQDIERLLGPQ